MTPAIFHTLTLNPSLDYLVTADRFVSGSLNRARDAQLFAGGKGINVALVLRRLGARARALGFLAGDTGRLLRAMLAAEGLKTDFVFLSAGMTRINLKLETPGQETELNGPGPAPDPAALAALEARLAAIPAGDTLVVSGSLPPGLAPEICAGWLDLCAARGVRCVLDAGGDPLRAGLAARPWLIKPNESELTELTGLPEGAVREEDALRGAMRAAQDLGAQNVLASLGERGAALLWEDGGYFFQPAPAGRPVNTAGAGDSLLAGFLAGLARGLDPAAALRLGVAAGSAAAFSPWLAGAQQIEELLAALPPA